MSTLFYVTVFHALGVYSTPWSHREEEGPHPIEEYLTELIFLLVDILQSVCTIEQSEVRNMVHNVVMTDTMIFLVF